MTVVRCGFIYPGVVTPAPRCTAEAEFKVYGLGQSVPRLCCEAHVGDVLKAIGGQCLVVPVSREPQDDG